MLQFNTENIALIISNLGAQCELIIHCVTDFPLLCMVKNKRSFFKHSIISFFLALSSTCLYSSFTDFVFTFSMQGLLTESLLAYFLWRGVGTA